MTRPQKMALGWITKAGGITSAHRGQWIAGTDISTTRTFTRRTVDALVADGLLMWIKWRENGVPVQACVPGAVVRDAEPKMAPDGNGHHNCLNLCVDCGASTRSVTAKRCRNCKDIHKRRMVESRQFLKSCGICPQCMTRKLTNRAACDSCSETTNACHKRQYLKRKKIEPVQP